MCRWETIPQWEAYSLSPEARRSHLPWVSQQMYGEAGVSPFGLPQTVSKNSVYVCRVCTSLCRTRAQVSLRILSPSKTSTDL